MLPEPVCQYPSDGGPEIIMLDVSYIGEMRDGEVYGELDKEELVPCEFGWEFVVLFIGAVLIMDSVGGGGPSQPVMICSVEEWVEREAHSRRRLGSQLMPVENLGKQADSADRDHALACAHRSSLRTCTHRAISSSDPCCLARSMAV